MDIWTGKTFGLLGHLDWRLLDFTHLDYQYIWTTRIFGLHPFGTTRILGLLGYLDYQDVRTVVVQRCLQPKCPNSPNVFKVQMSLKSKWGQSPKRGDRGRCLGVKGRLVKECWSFDQPHLMGCKLGANNQRGNYKNAFLYLPYWVLDFDHLLPF